MSTTDRRRGPANWLPYVAVGISLVSMVLGPCFGATVAVVGNYVTKQTDAAIAAEQRRQDSEKLKVIGDKVEEIFKQNAQKAIDERGLMGDMERAKADIAGLRHDVDENLKILQTYAAKVEGRRK